MAPKQRAALLLFALVLALGARPHMGRAQSPDRRLTLTFYYAWFDENTWTPSQVPDMPLQPYRSSDRATIERHVTQAQAAGIDAFVLSWSGPQEENNQTETNFRTLLDVAQAKGFQATVDFELTSPFYTDQADVIAALRYLLDTHAQHPAFLRYDDQPVIFFWRQQNYDVATWVAIRQQVDPTHTTLWIAEGVDLAYQDVFDGHHLYNITWNPPTDPAYTAGKFRGRIDAYNAAHGTHRLWIATVMPGYDDTHIAGRSGTYSHPRQNGAYYRQTWQAAVASNPDMIVITSFNEWREGTMIEPSVTYGDLYLNLTRELSDAYRQGAALPPAITPTPSPPPPPPPAPPPPPPPPPPPLAYAQRHGHAHTHDVPHKHSYSHAPTFAHSHTNAHSFAHSHDNPVCHCYTLAIANAYRCAADCHPLTVTEPRRPSVPRSDPSVPYRSRMAQPPATLVMLSEWWYQRDRSPPPIRRRCQPRCCQDRKFQYNWAYHFWAVSAISSPTQTTSLEEARQCLHPSLTISFISLFQRGIPCCTSSGVMAILAAFILPMFRHRADALRQGDIVDSHLTDKS